MFKHYINSKFFFVFFILFFLSNSINAKAENNKIDAVIDQLQVITQDLKTLERAVYKTAENTNSSGSISASNGLNE